MLKNTEKTMEKIVALCKTAASSSLALKFTAALPTHGTTALSAWR